MIIKWGIRNIVNFNIEKIEAISFIIVRKNSLIKLNKGNKCNIEDKEIKFIINIIR